MKRETSKLLKRFGVPPHLLGYKYIGDAIELIQEDGKYLYAITKALYPKIAKMNDTTYIRVERAIRHSIEYAFNSINKELIKEAFGNTYLGVRPTNGHFIATLAEIAEQEHIYED